jgi:PAS domain S-box-containing protein
MKGKTTPEDLEKRKKEEYLHLILDRMPYPVAIVDTSDDKILYWSKGAQNLFGHTASNAAEWYDLAYPDPACLAEGLSRWRPCVEEARISGETVNGGVYSITCSDGSICLCELYAAFSDDKLIVTFRDVTNEQKARDALLERTRFIDKVIESSALSTWISDDMGTAIRTNPACLGFFGTTEEEVVGHYNLLKDSVLEKAGVMPVIREVFSKGIPANVIVDYDFGAVDHINAENGTHKIINSIFTPILDEQGKVTNVICQAVDLTEIKNTEKALADEKERLLVTLRSIGDGCITTDTEGRVTLMNKVAEKLTGWPSKEALGKDVTDVFQLQKNHSAEPIENPVSKVIRTRNNVSTGNPETLISRGETKSNITSTTSPIFSENGELAGSVLIFRDITLQHELEMRLQQSERIESIGILAGGIAHDFNNLLAVITGNVSFALEDLNENSELFAILSDVMTGTRQAQKLTQQLLTFARGGTPVRVKSDLNALIRETTQFVLSGTKTRCEYDLAEELWVVEVDPGQINQTINNTVINACQALPDGGAIELKTWNHSLSPERGQVEGLKPGPYVCISIKDNGTGITPKHLSKIFDPYFSTKPGGSGLGLATAYSIIKRHLGSIKIKSTKGKGTEVTILLPAFEESLPAVSIKETPTHKGRGRILVMDDQEAILKMVTRMLKSSGYDVTCSRDGEEAIELFQKARNENTPFDLVILDLTIPGGMGGAETITALRAIEPKVMAIVSSGYSNDPIMANYREHGFCGVIPKPYGREELCECLNSILNRSE